MRSRSLGRLMLALVVLIAGCSRAESTPPTAPESSESTTKLAPPPRFYAFAANHDPNAGTFTEFELVHPPSSRAATSCRASTEPAAMAHRSAG